MDDAINKNQITLTEFFDDFNTIYVVNMSADLQMPKPCTYPFYSLFYIAHGKGNAVINAHKFEITEGDIFLINKNTSFFFQSSQPHHTITLYCCYFTSNALHEFLPNLKKDFSIFDRFQNSSLSFLHTKDFPKKKLRSYFLKMLDEFLYTSKGYLHVLKCLLILLLTEFLRKAEANSDLHTQHSFSGNQTVDQTIHSLNIYEKLNLVSLANEEGVSPEYLCSIFKKYTGTTLTNYINDRRIESIKDMLINTSRPINMILNKFDFNPAYLKRLFKERTGYTMREYREKYTIS